jgi:hypothetical protein
MVLGREFESQVLLKLYGKDGPLGGRKRTKIINTSKRG